MQGMTMANPDPMTMQIGIGQEMKIQMMRGGSIAHQLL